jgi:HD-like signal output (HDOD) protein
VTIETPLGAAPVPEFNPALDEIVNEIAELRALPAVAARVIEIAGGEQFSAHELAQAVASDQALTAKLLRLSNSAYYGYPRRITTVRDAVVLLGFRAVRSAALASCVISTLPSKPINVDPERFWRFSVSVGMLAEVLSHAHRKHEDEAFTAGVLHNIGRLALDQHRPRELMAVTTLALQKKISVADAERAVLGFTDAELGGALAAHWNFPEELVEAVRFHQLDPRKLPQPHSLAAYVVRARVFARASGLHDGIERRKRDTPDGEWLMPPISKSLQQVGGMPGVEDRVTAFVESALGTNAQAA